MSQLQHNFALSIQTQGNTPLLKAWSSNKSIYSRKLNEEVRTELRAHQSCDGLMPWTKTQLFSTSSGSHIQIQSQSMHMLEAS